MHASKPVNTPLATNMHLSNFEGKLLENPYNYRQMVRALQCLTFTRPDLAYAVNLVSQFMHSPREPHLHTVKQILRYVKRTINYGLHFSRSINPSLIAYPDIDWAGCLDTRRSTSGYCVYLGPNLISWLAKKQPTIARSSSEAEFRSLAQALAETIWIRRILRELGVTLHKPVTLFSDNLSATYMATNPVLHQRTKHIDIDTKFIREKLNNGDLQITHISTENQIADIFTKPLTTSRFQFLRSNLHIFQQSSD
jgi:hypothetical protein